MWIYILTFSDWFWTQTDTSVCVPNQSENDISIWFRFDLIRFLCVYVVVYILYIYAYIYIGIYMFTLWNSSYSAVSEVPTARSPKLGPIRPLSLGHHISHCLCLIGTNFALHVDQWCLTHLYRPVRSTFAVRETASLGIMGAQVGINGLTLVEVYWTPQVQFMHSSNSL